MIRRSLWFLSFTTLILIFLADWLFYKHPVGWTFSLFLMTAAAFVLLKGGAHLRSRATIAAAVLLLGLLIALTVQPGPLVLMMTLAVLALLAIAVRHGPYGDALEAVSRLIKFGFRAFLCAPKDTLLIVRASTLRTHRRTKDRLHTWINRWTLPIAGSLIFSGLFALANPVISREIHVLADTLDRLLLSLHLEAARVVFWLMTAGGAWALLRIKTRIKKKEQPPALPMSETRTSLLYRCLLLFNGVFAVQTALDATYLFAGVHLPNGMSYAEYAHRGAYPLVVTALLAAAFVLIGYRPGPATRETTSARRLVLLWLAQNGFLMLTAAWRLHVYTEIYGLTRLRVAAAIWMFLVGSGLAWIGLRIAGGKSNRWLINRCLTTTFIVLYLCCFINFDQWIAWQNVKNCREAGGSAYSLDYAYMLQLGPEAIPPLRWAASRGIRQPNNVALSLLYGRLNRQMQDWRGWTYRSWALWGGGLE